MNWLNIYTPTLRAPEFIGSEPTARATWLYVFAYCAEQENGGVIIGARGWKDRQWQQTCGVTLAEVEASSPLLKWRDQDLILHAYPMQKEAEVQRMRELGSLRTEGKALAARENGKKGGRKPNGNPTGGNPENPTETQRNGTQGTQREPIEGEEEGEWKEKKKGTEEEPPEEPAASPCSAFDEFWDAWPKKLARAAAEKAFAKVTEPIETLIAAIEQAEKSEDWKKEGGKYIPHAATWLNGKRWEDEVQTPKQSPIESFYRQPTSFPGFTPLANPYDTQGGKRLMQ